MMRTGGSMLSMTLLVVVARAFLVPPYNARPTTRRNMGRSDVSVEKLMSDLVRDASLDANELDGIVRRLNYLSIPLRKQALEAYAKQKEKRVGKEAIAHPGPYLMAIINNLETSQEEEQRNDLPSNNERDASTIHNSVPDNKSRSLRGESKKTKRTKEVESNSKKRKSKPPAATSSAPETTITSQDDDDLISMDTAQQCVELLKQLEQPISTLSGVGPKTAEAFARLNLYTIRSLLWHLPTSFIDRTKLCRDLTKATLETVVTLKVTVDKMYYSGKRVVTSNKKNVFQVYCRDESGNKLTVTFFCPSTSRGYGTVASYRRMFGGPGRQRIMSGTLKQNSNNGGFEMCHPDLVKPLDEVDAVMQIEPRYRLTKGLTMSRVKNTLDQALILAKELLNHVPEALPVETLQSLGWPRLKDALFLAHRPQQVTDYEGGPLAPPRMRLALEELCMQQAHLALARWRYKAPFVAKPTGTELSYYATWQSSPLVSTAVSLLPFELTSAQETCLQEAWQDANNDTGRMARLLQGDVSSGKTVVAYLLALGCIEANGGVAAILAPTTILANQHARSFLDFCQALNRHLPATSDHALEKIHVELLTGSITGKRREEILERLDSCKRTEAYFLIGTHALLTDTVADRLRNLQHGQRKGLSLAVVDEEQRFGVAQRDALSQCAAHTLYMTATPIPRTLALGGYTNMSPFYVRTGSMDISVLDSKPQGIKPVKTSIVHLQKVDQVVEGVKKHLAAGAKVFWILPRIGQDTDTSSEDEVQDLPPSDDTNVVERYNFLTEILGPNSVGMVHGRMATSEREAQLRAFEDPSLNVDVLVGTTVLEVGIDIPSVTILVVERAERFGLSQLHQLRGRIGRAVRKKGSNIDNDMRKKPDCHCVLLAGDASINGVKRLNVLRETDDGARVAMADFEMRGPGEMIGLQQAGLKNGNIVDLSHHFDLVHPAALLGRSFVEKDALDMISETTETAKDTLLKKVVANNNIQALKQVSSLTRGGIRLRVGLSLFGNWKTTSEDNNVPSALRSLKDYTFLKANQIDGEDEVEGLFQSLAKTHIDHSKATSDTKPVARRKKTKVELPDAPKIRASDESETTKVSKNHAASSDLIEQWKKSKPKTSPRKKSLPKITLNGSTDLSAVFQGDQGWVPDVSHMDLQLDKDTVFLVIDTETTGLSTSDHVIQVAAKVLGSSDAADQFSAYCCPPVHLDPLIEELTGITDRFLHHGGVDKSTGERVKGAEPFQHVYKDFCDFCNGIRQEKNICIVAHNAPFDVRMLNSEVKRLAATARAEGKKGLQIPLFSRDTGIVSSIDTLQLFRSREFWNGSCPRPSSFNLESVYTHVFQSPMVSAHNACGDVLGLERILFSDELRGWEKVGQGMQKPISIPSSITTNLLEQ